MRVAGVLCLTYNSVSTDVLFCLGRIRTVIVHVGVSCLHDFISVQLFLYAVTVFCFSHLSFSVYMSTRVVPFIHRRVFAFMVKFQGASFFRRDLTVLVKLSRFDNYPELSAVTNVMGHYSSTFSLSVPYHEERGSFVEVSLYYGRV